MRRKLGNVEHAFTYNGRAAPLAAVTILHINPALDPDDIRRALPILQRRHPLLRATLHTEGNNYYHEVGPDSPTIPVTVIPRQSDAHWRQIATAELNREIGQDNTPLLRLTYLYAAETADIIFSFHHSIIDGASGANLLNEFMALATGQANFPEARSIVSPAEARFPAAYKGLRGLPRLALFFARQMADEAVYRRQARGTRAQPLYPTAQCAIVERQVDTETVARLTQTCRRRRITLNNLLSAALLSAVYHHLYDDQPTPLRAIMFGNLRSYLEPPLPKEDFSCSITMLRHTILVKKEMDIWQLAAALQAKNNAGFERGEKFLAAIFTKYVIQMTLKLKAFRLATSAVSYAGPFPLQKQFGPIEITGLHAFVSNNRFGPEYVSVAYLLFGRLVWNFVYLDTDMTPETAEAIATHAIHLLQNAAEDNGQ